ncbi:YgaP family membrane protein [Thalassobacillus pellis]|uniref:YgaP family membrane protein n=1 Tax=Thalassobacillus pellis TaxID=748008 RepID=UPI00195F938A|nr:DUF2892 domain-containing protein [Thalassobacillus pellis]MBM7553411.1 hypothetical protein [Thalassobacillus pellis]
MLRVKPNIGILNAMFRITGGLTLMVFYVIRSIKRPYDKPNLWMIMAGAMKVAEGIVRYCPVTAAAKTGIDMMDDDRKHQHESAINPS